MIRFVVPHSASAFTFSITGTGLQAANDESWGIDNFKLTIQSLETTEETPYTFTLQASDAETISGSLTYATTPPLNGTLNTDSLPTVTYTPNENFSGADTFTYSANDGNTTSAPMTVTIVVTEVNDAPVADAQTVGGTEDTNATITLTGADVDTGDTLSYLIASLPAAGSLYQTSDGTTLGSQIASVPTTVTDTSHRVIFVPVANANGSGYGDFTFKVNDGAVDSSAATVTVDIAAGTVPAAQMRLRHRRHSRRRRRCADREQPDVKRYRRHASDTHTRRERQRR